MNKRLTTEIFDIVSKLQPDEIASFESRAKRKKRKDGKEHGYLRLFRVYTKQAGNLLLDEKHLNLQARKISKSPNDLHQDLRNELHAFLLATYRVASQDKIVTRINDLIDTASAMAERGLYSAALDNLKQAIVLLQEQNPNGHRDESLYLSVKAGSLLIEYKLRSNIKEKDKDFFQDFDEEGKHFMQLAHNMHSHLIQAKKDRLTHFKSEDLPTGAFYMLLNIYLKYMQDFQTLVNNSNRRRLIASYLPGRISSGNESIDEARQAFNEKLIHTNSVLIKLERLYAALMLGEDWAFDEAYNEVSSSLYHRVDTNYLNSHLAVLVYRALFETQLIFSHNNSKPALDVYKLHDLTNLTRAQFDLFTETEISGFALRLELNSMIVLFLQNNYIELLHRLTQLSEQTKINRLVAYYPDIIALEIVARLELGGHYDEDLDKRVQYYEGYGKKNPNTVPVFHRTFASCIKSFRNASSKKEREDVVKSYGKKLHKNRESFNHFHHLFLNWIESKIDSV
ncbi:MAG: hypothetical protein L6Q81_05040 [Bacteroidia bacterium]|nr:hypothetical protein [Bacteroidia bacterium]